MVSLFYHKHCTRLIASAINVQLITIPYCQASLRRGLFHLWQFSTQFNLDHHQYRFENYCKENKDLALGDGAEKIFLNLNGYIKHDENLELIQFLRYVKNSTGEVAKDTIELKSWINFSDSKGQQRSGGQLYEIRLDCLRSRAERD